MLKKSKVISSEIITTKKNNFQIVGIGASAGGLEALELFFENTPKNSGMAYVVIQHLAPDYVGMLPELLQRVTPMTVQQATQNLQIMRNQVYVIPPNKSMTVVGGILHLLKPTEPRGLRLPIDTFFESLAIDKKEMSIGIVLSGMGADGSIGLKAIKESNGIVLVQDPADAKFNAMPQSALEATEVDIVSPANRLPASLTEFLKLNSHPKLLTIHTPIFDEDASGSIEKIILLLQIQTGHDFSLYKKNTLYRRIERRMMVHRVDKINNYVRFLQENPIEAEILFKELLIGVTNFFREPEVWEKLKTELFPALFESAPDGYVFRAWVAGCSTGEEAYSLAIIFREAYENTKLEKHFSLQIFASDLENDAIILARKGEFPASISKDVTSTRLSQFFTLNGNGFRINATIREMVIFANQNVIKDPPFTKLDFLSCRNMLIYMEPELQKKLITLFHYCLKPGGLMLLGSAENESSGNGNFSILDAKLKFFKRSEIQKNIEIQHFPSSFSQSKITQTDIQLKPMKEIENIQILTDKLLLQRFLPASVLINDQGDILYITGKTGKYLEPAAGRANMNIYAMAREGLNTMMAGAIRKAKLNFEPLHFKNIKVGAGSNIHLVDITIQQNENPEALKGTIMVLFSDAITVISEKTSKKSNVKLSSAHQQELEVDLKRLNEELQSTQEEMQTSQEELKSTNEEMQSTNEELQSTNEELTTSKEEMQSLNEELQTVNVELQTKISDFEQSNNDMINLLNSTDIATLFLDKALNIRRFTDQLKKIVKLRTSDIGRPFTEIANDLQYPKITAHAKEVLRTLTAKETAITTNSGNWFTVRIMPYRTFEDKIDGVVITFIDVTKAKKLEIELNETVELLRKHNLYKP